MVRVWHNEHLSETDRARGENVSEMCAGYSLGSFPWPLLQHQHTPSFHQQSCNSPDRALPLKQWHCFPPVIFPKWQRFAENQRRLNSRISAGSVETCYVLLHSKRFLIEGSQKISHRSPQNNSKIVNRKHTLRSRDKFTL